MSEVKPYVMTWKGGADDDVDLETRVAVYGPFDSEKAAEDWGSTNEDDDPRWQVVMLSNENMQEKYLLVPILSAV
jgi:hypothetical protein